MWPDQPLPPLSPPIHLGRIDHVHELAELRLHLVHRDFRFLTDPTDLSPQLLHLPFFALYLFRMLVSRESRGKKRSINPHRSTIDKKKRKSRSTKATMRTCREFHNPQRQPPATMESGWGGGVEEGLCAVEMPVPPFPSRKTPCIPNPPYVAPTSPPESQP